jgi:hypothetical protein
MLKLFNTKIDCNKQIESEYNNEDDIIFQELNKDL